MNAERLLAHYHRIADAPDAVARLRRFILELAVRGKLVRQEPHDEPAKAYADRLSTKRRALQDRGAIPKDRLEPALVRRGPFEIPPAWAWVPFGQLHVLVRGVTYSKSDVSEVDAPGFVPVLRANNIGSTLTHDEPVFVKGDRIASAQLLRKGDYLIALSSGSKNLVGKAAFVPKDLDAAFGGFCGVIRLYDADLQRFVGVFLQSDLYRSSLSAGSRGIGINNLKKESIANLHFPLPPLAEQHRIVAKVDELMALCDQLEAARSAREATRDRLTAAILARLNDPDPEPATFAQHARCALDALPTLTARADQIKQLRQTILGLAVRGKLVLQCPDDEPAAGLLRRIQVELDRLGLRRAAEPLESTEAPFELPHGWSWARIGEICSKTGSGSTPRGGKDVYKARGVPFLRSQNVYDDGLRLNDVAFIDDKTHLSMQGTRVLPGDLLLNITGGSMGRCCRVPGDFAEANVSQHVAIIRVAIKGMEDFLHLLILSPYFQAFIFDEQTGAGRGGLPKNRMDRIVVALPPLEEQRRIVAKVHLLMSLCARLESGVVAGEAARQHLLNSLIAGVAGAHVTTPAKDVLAA